MRTAMVRWCILVLILSLAVVASAQDTCPQVVSLALLETGTRCTDTQRNSVCYGHQTVEAGFKAGYEVSTFVSPGDKTDLFGVSKLVHLPMEIDAERWGVSLLRVQANLPDTLPGQNVTMLLFGDLTLEDATDAQPGAVQAFYFQSGIGDAPCREAPDSGILIHTPVGLGQIQLRVNEVDLSIGSTIYLEAAPAADGVIGKMTVNVVEGGVDVSALGGTQHITDGLAVDILLDRELKPIQPPAQPRPVDADVISRLPLELMFILAEQPVVEPLSTEPCVIYSERDQTAELRVGPGENRSIMGYLVANNRVEVTGQQELWWQLNKQQALPGTMATELWVAKSQVMTEGACELVARSDAPPVVAPRPTAVIRPPVETEEPGPAVTEIPEPEIPPLMVNFWADDTTIFPGSCTTVHIQAGGTKALFFEEEGIGLPPGTTWNREVCPKMSTTYTLRVITATDEEVFYYLDITVSRITGHITG